MRKLLPCINYDYPAGAIIECRNGNKALLSFIDRFLIRRGLVSLNSLERKYWSKDNAKITEYDSYI